MYFVDSEFVPMLLQENYLRPHERPSKASEVWMFISPTLLRINMKPAKHRLGLVLPGTPW